MDLYMNLAANMEELAGSFDARMHHMESNIKKLSTTEAPHKDLESLSREFFDFKALIWKCMATMRSQLELLIQGLDRQETASRRKILLFHGIAESNETVVEDTIIKLLTDQFKISGILPNRLDACYRMGAITSKPRPVMVRFADYKLRSLVWNAKTLLKGTLVTVSEFLTKPRHDVFIAARKHFGIRRCWTSEGKIVVLLPDNKRRRIETASELKPLLAEFPSIQPDQNTKALGTSLDKGKNPAFPAAKTTKSAEPRSTRRAVK